MNRAGQPESCASTDDNGGELDASSSSVSKRGRRSGGARIAGAFLPEGVRPEISMDFSPENMRAEPVLDAHDLAAHAVHAAAGRKTREYVFSALGKKKN